MNIPNYLSTLRIVLIPILVILFFLPPSWSTWGAGFLFLLAALTDWLDGYLARTLKQTSKLGAFLDPVADKLIIATSLILLVAQPQLSPYIVLPTLIIVCREIMISALREWMAEVGRRHSVAVSYIAKIKTAAQMFSITILLVFHLKPHSLGLYLGYFALYTASALTLWSMLMYLKAAWPDLSQPS